MSHQVDPGLKALGFQPVESTSPFKVLVSDVNLRHYTEGRHRRKDADAPGEGDVAAQGGPAAR